MDKQYRHLSVEECAVIRVIPEKLTAYPALFCPETTGFKAAVWREEPSKRMTAMGPNHSIQKLQLRQLRV